jgi:PAS domain S-box-containing protein
MTRNGHGDASKAALLTDEEREKSVVISDPALPDTPIIFTSNDFEEQTGYSPQEVLGRNCRFLQGPDTDPNAIEAIRHAIAAETRITIDILNYRKDGTKFWNRLRIRPVFDKKGKLKYFVGNQNPIPAEEVRPGSLNGVVD